MSAGDFLGEPAPSPAAARLFDVDRAEMGYEMNVTRLWAHQPDLFTHLFELVGDAARMAGLDLRRRGILVAACASTIGDAYCALAWGAKLAAASDPDTAAAVLRGDDQGLNPAERVLAEWARAVARDPNATSAADVQRLRDAGFTDPEILAITLFVGLRMAFSSVNDALGAAPDPALRSTAPPAVLDAVTYGRPIAGTEADG